MPGKPLRLERACLERSVQVARAGELEKLPVERRVFRPGSARDLVGRLVVSAELGRVEKPVAPPPAD